MKNEAHICAFRTIPIDDDSRSPLAPASTRALRVSRAGQPRSPDADVKFKSRVARTRLLLSIPSRNIPDARARLFARREPTLPLVSLRESRGSSVLSLSLSPSSSLACSDVGARSIELVLWRARYHGRAYAHLPTSRVARALNLILSLCNARSRRTHVRRAFVQKLAQRAARGNVRSRMIERAASRSRELWRPRAKYLTGATPLIRRALLLLTRRMTTTRRADRCSGSRFREVFESRSYRFYEFVLELFEREEEPKMHRE